MLHWDYYYIIKMCSCLYFINCCSVATVLEFTNGTNKPKLIGRIQSLCQAYERPCLIVETDRQNRHGDQTIHKPLYGFPVIYMYLKYIVQISYQRVTWLLLS